MPAKVSEKKLLGSILLFVSSFVFLLTVKLFADPVRFSERGLLFLLIAFVLLAIAVRQWKRAFVKV
jgi:O-antigen ligase